MARPNLPDNVRSVRSTGKNIRGVKNNKWNQLVAFESREGEEKVTQILHRNRLVENFWSQSEKFEFIDEEGQARSHVPDYKVLFTDGHIEIWDITSRKRMSDKGNLMRISGTRKICEERGWVYVLIFIEDLPAGTEAANLDALYGFRARVLYNEVIVGQTLLLVKHSPWYLMELAEEVSKTTGFPLRNTKATILYMIWWGDLQVDLKKDLIVLDGDLNPDVVVLNF